MKHLITGLFLPIFLFGFFTAQGQTYKVEGIVKDHETNQPIVGASVILKNSNGGTTANEQGAFKLDLVNFPAVVFIQCIGYLRDTVTIESEKKYISDYKNQKLVVSLRQNPIQIGEVQVKARSTLFEKDPYAIIDYKIVGSKIIALGFKNGNEFRKEVLLADLTGKMISNHLYKNLDSLYQDCQGNVFAFCKDSALELKITRRQVALVNGYKRNFIVDNITPVCGITDSLILLKKSSFNHQYDNYFALRDSQSVLLIYSTGGLMKERQAASLQNTWADQAKVPITLIPPVGCGGGCMNGWLRDVYEPAFHRYFGSQFTLMTDFRPVFTKMITRDKDQLIFDREAATIYWLDKKGEITREVGMNNKLNGIYFQDVHVDSVTGRIYLEFPQGAFTHFIELNPATGQEIRRFMVSEYRHIEKCEFLNDRLYFLYQPDVGTRIKKVFSIWI